MEKVFDKDQTQNRLGKISRATLDRQIAKGFIVPVRIGRRVFFRESEIERFIRCCEERSRKELSE